jgi:hypothetical protein
MMRLPGFLLESLVPAGFLTRLLHSLSVRADLSAQRAALFVLAEITELTGKVKGARHVDAYLRTMPQINLTDLRAPHIHDPEAVLRATASTCSVSLIAFSMQEAYAVIAGLMNQYHAQHLQSLHPLLTIVDVMVSSLDSICIAAGLKLVNCLVRSADQGPQLHQQGEGRL